VGRGLKHGRHTGSPQEAKSAVAQDQILYEDKCQSNLKKT
jgi:hypothetical protein